MKNFKEIAEKCLAGKLSGIFVLQDGSEVKSNYLRKLPPTTNTICSYGLCEWYISDNGNAYGDTGYLHGSSVKKFIPDNIQELKIDIPEGKVPVMEQTESGVVITWEEKLTFSKIYNDLVDKDQQISSTKCCANYNSIQFNQKIEVLRKLTNIRNYFGKPKHGTYGHVLYYTIERGIHTTPALYPSNDQRVIFDTKEHAEQAIKMLGDELKYLFEPW